MHELHITRERNLAVWHFFAHLRVAVAHIERKRAARHHFRLEINRDLVSGHVHVAFAEENLQRFCVTRFEELEGVRNRVLGAEDADNVAAPRLDLVVRRVNSAGNAVLADVTALHPLLRERFSESCREIRPNRGVHDAAGSRYWSTNKNVVESHGSSPFDRCVGP